MTDTIDTEYGDYQPVTDLYHLISLPSLKGGMEKNPQWRDQSACLGSDISFFDGHRTAKAKAVCAKCPVIKECLEFAITTGQDHGVWGGLTEAERKDIKL